MKLNIVHMYPDVLNLYGDSGNVVCLERRLLWRGIEAEITRLPIGAFRTLADADIVFIGGGQDFEQEVLLDDLHRGKAAEIKAAVEDGATFLAVCGGYQMLGEYYETFDGKRCDFIGALELATVGAKKRMIGNCMFECMESIGGGTVVGFENHSGKTRLGGSVEPLGKVICGFGNNGEDGFEGAHYKNVFGTYSHGPVLPKNPELCDLLLLTALRRKYGAAELAPLNDMLEAAAHREMCEKIGGKK